MELKIIKSGVFSSPNRVTHKKHGYSSSDINRARIFGNKIHYNVKKGDILFIDKINGTITVNNEHVLDFSNIGEIIKALYRGKYAEPIKPINNFKLGF